MRLLALTPVIPWPADQGDKVRIGALLERLATRHRVSVVALSWEPPRDVSLPMGIELATVWREKNRWRTAMRALLEQSPYHVVACRSTTYRRVVDAIAQSFHPQLVLCHTTWLWPYAESIGVPVIVDQVNVDSYRYRSMAQASRHLPLRWFAELQARRMARWERWVFDHAAACLAVSEEDRGRTLELTATARVDVIPNGVDLELFRPATPPHVPDHPEVVFVGSFGALMNVDAVVHFSSEVWPRIRAVLPDARFSVVGRDPPPSITALDGRDGVRIVGAVPDIRPYVAQASVVVVPVRMAGGTKLKVLEGMAMGKALVTTRAGAEGLAVAHDREVMIADDAESFAAAVVRVMQDGPLRTRLGEAARKFVEGGFGWDLVVTRLHRLLAGLETRP